MALDIKPPAKSADQELEELKVASAVQEVSEEDVQDVENGQFVAPETVHRDLERREASSIVEEINSVPARSVEFKRKMAIIDSFGNDAINRASGNSNSILSRSSSSIHGAKKNGSVDSAKIAGDIGELRGIVEKISPKGELTTGKKILGFIPGTNTLKRFVRRYETAEDGIQGIVEDLDNGRDLILRDNSAILAEQEGGWNSIQDLSKARRVLDDIDEEVTNQVELLRREGKNQEADAMTADMLSPVRQRKQDVTTQITVAIQSYLSLGIIEQNNKELANGIKRIQTTTIAALRNASTVAISLAQQSQMLDSMDAVTATTNRLIDENSKNLETNTVRIHERSQGIGIDPDVLDRSFAAITNSMDSLDRFKIDAAKQMRLNTERLEKNIARSEGFVNRARATQERSVEQQNESDQRGIGR